MLTAGSIVVAHFLIPEVSEFHKGNLLKGIVIWFIRSEGIEPIRRVSSLLLSSSPNKMVQNGNFYI